ncbi:MAG: DUF2207 domain-containing protein [Candidatus Paceibacterota bacterium]|jgi:uncharacterized membrane protein YgcG
MWTLVLLALAACLITGVCAGEEIRDFSSRIEILPDSDLIVTETIRVMPEGNQIKRGIYRDFPTLYAGKAGLRASVPFKVLEILRDGKPEPWHSERKGNGIRIYLGSENVFLPHEETTYTIKYRTGRQLGFFKDFDELYWNVTGNGWEFPILQASACVDLPPGAGPRSMEAYTGRKGDRGSACRVAGSEDVSLATTAPLSPGEGFTIAVTWPKGFVKRPSSSSGWLSLASSNRGLIAGGIGLLAVFGYFFVGWILVGRDPESGVIIPHFEPPEGFTPQDVRYLDGLGTCDNTSFTAAIMHLAVQKALRITESSKHVYTIGRDTGAGMDDAEDRLLESLFSESQTVKLTNTRHALLAAARKVLAKDLAAKNDPYFHRNTHVWVVGLLATLVPLGISILDANDFGGAVFMMLWLSIWSLGCAALSHAVFSAWRGRAKWTAIPVTLFSLPFFAGWLFGMWALVQAASPWVCALYVAGILLCVIFHHLLKRPTPEGQKLRDRIRGFKKYLSVAEAERLGLENPPERTPELFEKFLPHALALGVEQEWSEQFSEILTEAAQAPESGLHSLVLPAASSAFAGALSSAISSASTAPGSSSGSGGGGSSGGGGGGGGGGGW